MKAHSSPLRHPDVRQRSYAEAGAVSRARQRRVSQKTSANLRLDGCDTWSRRTLAHDDHIVITDEQGSAWFDSQGAENGDKCAWNFGTVSGPAGAEYNQVINGNLYYLQQEWSNATSGCRLSYP